MHPALRFFLGFLLVLALASGLWWVLQRNQAQREDLVAMTRQDSVRVSVRTAPARTIDFRDSFTVHGSFQPARQAAVVTTLPGQITALHVAPGSLVRAGQTLLEIDSAYTANELRAAEIKLAQGQKNVRRMENLIGEGGVTQRQYEEALAQVESAAVQLQSLRQRIRDARVVAPISGYVTPIPRTPFPVVGGFAGQGNPVFLLVDVARLHFRVLLTAEQLAQVELGEEVRIREALATNDPLRGKVIYKGVTTEILSRRYPVDIELTNPPGHPLRGGMTGRATFIADASETLLVIPRQAVLASGGQDVVYLVDGQRAHRQAITIGRRRPDWVSVQNGLAAGDRVVLSGQINLSDGAPVSVIEEEER